MKSFMNELSMKFQGFMQGRNGIDSLSTASALLALVVLLVNIFVSNVVVAIIGDALLLYFLFRVFSKNVSKRRAEVEGFEKLIQKPKQALLLSSKKIQNRKTTCYFTCSNCKKVYSVPKGKGKIRTTCPHCHEKEIHTT